MSNSDFWRRQEALDFEKAVMPPGRTADYQLSCLGGCIFIDFNLDKEERIYLLRISFDGYGCYNLKAPIKTLDAQDSQSFQRAFQSDPIDQKALEILTRRLINLNSDQIGSEALKEYALNNDLG